MAEEFTNKRSVFRILYANEEEKIVEKPIEGLESTGTEPITVMTREYLAIRRRNFR
jgi:hypothetical protein